MKRKVGILYVPRRGPRPDNKNIISVFFRGRIAGLEIITSESLEDLTSRLLSGELGFIFCPVTSINENIEKEFYRKGVRNDYTFKVKSIWFQSFVKMEEK